MIRTGNEELFRKGDVLEVSCPEQERVLCRRTTQVIVTRRLDSNAKVVGLGKFYSSLNMLVCCGIDCIEWDVSLRTAATIS